MRLLIIRHGDPDYTIDGLTEKGKREAELLAEKLCAERLDHIYCSTLGRARLTIEPTLKKLGMTAEYFPWLREFNYKKLDSRYTDKQYTSPWDIMPSFVNENPDFYHPVKWRELEFVKGTGLPEAYDEVSDELDALLAKHGYVREGLNYRVERRNHDTIVLVCHFGLAATLLSHMFNCSPYSLWQHTCLAPTSVSTIWTEERQEGIALMRAQSIGDLSHLYVKGEPPAFAARFCECFTDDTRH